MSAEAIPGGTASPTAHEQFLSFLESQEETPAGAEDQSEELVADEQVEGGEAEPAADDQQEEVGEIEEEPEAPAPEPRIRLEDGRELSAKEIQKEILMQADYTKKRQAAAEKERAVDAEHQRILGEKDRVAQSLKQIEAAVAAMTQAEPNWEQVRKERPDSFVEEYADYQVQKSRMDKIVEMRQKAEREVQEEQFVSFSRHIEREAEILAEKIPEWKDPAKKKAEGQRIKDYAIGLGFTEDQLKAGITDHRMVLLLRDAARFHGLKTRTTQQIPGKKVAPAVLRPGSNAPVRPPTSDLTRLKQRLAKTGRQQDAQAFFLKSGLLD